MRKKITGILAISLLLTSGLSATSIAAEENIQDEFVPVVEELDDKNDFMINPNLTLDEEFDEYMEEELIYFDLPELEGNELPEEYDEDDYEEEAAPMMRFRMFAMPAPFAQEAQNLKISQPGIGAFVNDGENYNIYSAASGGSKLSYVNSATAYNGDAAILEESNDRYKIVLAGLEGWISKNALKYYDIKQIKSVSHYEVNSSGDLIHYLSKGSHQTGYTSINNGYAPAYLSPGVNYFSFDGHYFYSSLEKMLSDYKAGTRANAINTHDPFYNYYQFLSYRAKSFINQNDIDSFIKSKGYTATIDNKHKGSSSEISDIPSNQSMLYGQSHHFVNQMNKFGANSSLTFALAIHESGWGRSFLARSRNNLFGHAAYDSYPGAADKYASIEEAIHSHNTHFINWHYVDYTDTSGHYQGGMLGNKESGINVHYASDAYWGEKAAAHYLELDRHSGSKDYGKYRIGVKKDSQTVNLRKEPTTQSPAVLTASVKNQSFIIYDTVEGETINGSNKWYKINSDHILTKERDLYKWKGAATSREVPYLLNQSYVYVHESFLIDVNIPKANPIEDPTIPSEELGYKKGDIDGNGKIELRDLTMVKSHLLGKYKLQGNEFKAADIDNNGKIELRDLTMIKSHLLGKYIIR